MNEENKFYAGYWIRRFLCEYLTNIRNLSANTLKSYRDAIRLLMPFIAKCVKKEVDKILLTDITDTRVADFLERQVMFNQDQKYQTGCFLFSCKVCIRQQSGAYRMESKYKKHTCQEDQEDFDNVP